MRIRREYRLDDNACLRALLRLLQYHLIVGDLSSVGSCGGASAPQRGDGSTRMRGVR